MFTSIADLSNKLYNELGVTNIKFTPGDGPITAEGIAREIQKSIEAIESGDFDIADDID